MVSKQNLENVSGEMKKQKGKILRLQWNISEIKTAEAQAPAFTFKNPYFIFVLVLALYSSA